MALSKTAREFFGDHLPTRTKDGCYLMEGREGFQPWQAEEVERYVACMLGLAPFPEV